MSQTNPQKFSDRYLKISHSFRGFEGPESVKSRFCALKSLYLDNESIFFRSVKTGHLPTPIGSNIKQKNITKYVNPFWKHFFLGDDTEKLVAVGSLKGHRGFKTHPIALKKITEVGEIMLSVYVL